MFVVVDIVISFELSIIQIAFLQFKVIDHEEIDECDPLFEVWLVRIALAVSRHYVE